MTGELLCVLIRSWREKRQMLQEIPQTSEQRQKARPGNHQDLLTTFNVQRELRRCRPLFWEAELPNSKSCPTNRLPPMHISQCDTLESPSSNRQRKQGQLFYAKGRLLTIVLSHLAYKPKLACTEKVANYCLL